MHASLAGIENEKFLEQVFTLHGHVEGNMVLSSLYFSMYTRIFYFLGNKMHLKEVIQGVFSNHKELTKKLIIPRITPNNMKLNNTSK